MGFAIILNCGIMNALFSYMGLTIGGNHKRRNFWEGVFGKFRSRLGL